MRGEGGDIWYFILHWRRSRFDCFCLNYNIIGRRCSENYSGVIRDISSRHDVSPAQIDFLFAFTRYMILFSRVRVHYSVLAIVVLCLCHVRYRPRTRGHSDSTFLESKRINLKKKLLGVPSKTKRTSRAL